MRNSVIDQSPEAIALREQRAQLLQLIGRSPMVERHVDQFETAVRIDEAKSERPTDKELIDAELERFRDRPWYRPHLRQRDDHLIALARASGFAADLDHAEERLGRSVMNEDQLQELLEQHTACLLPNSGNCSLLDELTGLAPEVTSEAAYDARGGSYEDLRDVIREYMQRLVVEWETALAGADQGIFDAGVRAAIRDHIRDIKHMFVVLEVKHELEMMP